MFDILYLSIGCLGPDGLNGSECAECCHCDAREEILLLPFACILDWEAVFGSKIRKRSTLGCTGLLPLISGHANELVQDSAFLLADLMLDGLHPLLDGLGFFIIWT